ncbi:LppX_LprAFG lipoprotein [Nocardiopsis sp. LOL_012]|uniref:LppX_LprAFG lipoprotein n=1 Tax=Nocardiopsis sp. LOL_012 TaxID=3345409 RepID=UPI003A8418A6
MKTGIPAALSVGVLALSLTACGGSAQEGATTSEGSEAAGGATSVLDLIDGLADNTDEVTNYTLETDIVSTGPEAIGISITMEVMDDPEAVRTSMYMPFMAEMVRGMAELQGQDVEGLTTEELGTTTVITLPDGTTLTSNHTGLQGADTPWIRGESDTQVEISDQDFDRENLGSLYSALTDIDSFEETGTEEVNGVPTTRVEGTLTAEQYAALAPEQQEAFGSMNESGGTMDVSVWIGDDGFPMRMEFSGDEGDMAMVFSKLGETSFEIPAEDQITDI